MRINLFNVQMFKSFQILWLSYVTILKCVFFRQHAILIREPPISSNPEKSPNREERCDEKCCCLVRIAFLDFSLVGAEDVESDHTVFMN